MHVNMCVVVVVVVVVGGGGGGGGRRRRDAHICFDVHLIEMKRMVAQMTVCSIPPLFVVCVICIISPLVCDLCDMYHFPPCLLFV